MTSNYELKTKCKEKLNAIRSMLSPEERQKVETHLRDILEITKGLMDNAKVSPEDHHAVVSQVATLTSECSRRDEELQAIRKEANTASKLRDQLATEMSQAKVLELDAFFNEAMYVNLFCSSLRLLAMQGSRYFEKEGTAMISKWVKDMLSTIEDDADRHALFLICLFMAGFTVDEETVAEVVDGLSAIEAPDASGLWLEEVRDVFVENDVFCS